MATTVEPIELVFPELPAKHNDFLAYIAQNADKPLLDLLEPYKQYDAELRKAFAQQPNHPAVSIPNVLPVFNGMEGNLRIRARNLATESQRVSDSYIMPLQPKDRKANDTPAIVDSIGKFKEQFSLFSESALSDMDWSNVVAAGSAVVTPLLPIPDRYSGSKRATRQYYHEVFAPASDVDLFIYGLTEEQAINKIRQIENKIKDALLVETTTVRTKNAITIASQYPTRHIQIVLRIYKSISEILTGFDVDCSCACYDGEQVWANPRALVAYMTQINTIDLTRRSPSYENRLSKYRHRGFEVYWPDLDRTRIDPTIFERSFLRTQGLARLLVLEKLPTSDERDAYLDQRRLERGRPAANRSRRQAYKLIGDIKTGYEDEVAEWVDEEDVSSYHTFTIPYGPHFHAAKIEKLLYTKDLLLNAEWNKPKDREVHLHRHPAFFGSVDDIIHDCCGYCPKPTTMEEEEAHEVESGIYVSGEITFLKDDPGRQTIGSFNPLSADDYTEMAYVGNTGMLCRAIVDGDVEFVESWLDQEGNDPNTRDYTGRTPLHLAVMQSKVEVVQALIDKGARLIARLVDGRTALHLACMRGNLPIVQALLKKSATNEEEENEKVDARREAHRAKTTTPAFKDDSAEEDSDIDIVDGDDQTDIDATTENSIVNIKSVSLEATDQALDDENKDEPDIYDVNIVAWDTAVTPLHLAILKGHVDIVKCLVQEFGADVLLPAKLFERYSPGTPRAALLTLVLALQLPHEKAEQMSRALFELGATCSQADLKHETALHVCAIDAPELLDIYQHSDANGVKRAINHCSVTNGQWSPNVHSALMSAIEARDGLTALKLMALGAKPTITFSAWSKTTQLRYKDDRWYTPEMYKARYHDCLTQPVLLAVTAELPEVALRMITEHDVDINTLTPEGQRVLRDEHTRRWTTGTSLLDLVKSKLRELKAWTFDDVDDQAPVPLQEDAHYLSAFEPDSYQRWVAERQVSAAKKAVEKRWEGHVATKKAWQQKKGLEEKQAAIFDAIDKYRKLEAVLEGRGAKTFQELHPDIKISEEQSNHLGSWNHGYSPFEGVKFHFKEHPLSDDLRQRYLELFAATWRGDTDTVKKYVLTPWFDSEGTKQSPLKIAVWDGMDMSPFAIAVLRGHRDLALIVLEIAKAQYLSKGEDEEQRRTRLRGQGDYQDSDEDDDSSDVPIETEILMDQFTIENIGEVAVEVTSSVSPTQMLNSINLSVSQFDLSNVECKGTTSGEAEELLSPSNLVQWAIWQKNIQVLEFLLDAGAKYHVITVEGEDPYGVPYADWLYAISVKDIQILALIIKTSGAGVPLHQFVKRSGIELGDQPKYYQGLSVRGAKKKEWALRGRNQRVTESWEKIRPPMLEAAFRNSLEIVEWFQTDAPLRCYKHYADTHPEDKRLKQLQHHKGGFEKMVKQFLNARVGRTLHCAVMAGYGRSHQDRSTTSSELLKHLIGSMPDSINVKSEEGMTPLHIAFALCHEQDARLLIEAGADQSVRDKHGRNLIHMLLSHSAQCDRSKAYLEAIQRMLGLIDMRLLKSMFEERSAAHYHTQTPFVQWLTSICEGKHELDACRLLLETSQGVELNLMDGEGNTPLHTALRRGNYWVCKHIIERDPRLIHRENATGRTPYEQVEDQVLADYFNSQDRNDHAYERQRRRYGRAVPDQINLVDRASEEFVGQTEPSASTTDRIWQLLQDTKAQLEAQGQSTRTLVTLNEANEVARRLAATQTQQQSSPQEAASGEEEDVHTAGDEVQVWFQRTSPTHARGPPEY